MNKKFLALILALVLALSLAACGGKDAPAQGGTPAPPLRAETPIPPIPERPPPLRRPSRTWTWPPSTPP